MLDAPRSASPLRWSAAWAVLPIAIGVVAYLYGLHLVAIPNIGDEPLYLQIARRTLDSGRLLPLLSDTGITDTKPPLLFWQGIAAAHLAGFELLWLRLPNVLLTFATAALAGLLAARASGRRGAGVVAASVFLAFWSTVQHGRPFLTNAGETLFLFLPLVLVSLRAGGVGPALAMACGLSLGVASLYKSFAVIVPGTLGLALVLRRRARGDLATFLRERGPFLAIAAGVACGVFALWFLFDPRPDLILSEFVLRENAGKFQAGQYLAGLVSGPYPVWRIWVGPLRNALILAPVLLGLAVDLWRRRRALPDVEAELWRYVLAFLVFYSLPAQRQENYLLPAMAVLAVLLALRWDAIPFAWFRVALVPLAVAAAAVPLLETRVEAAIGATVWSPWMVAIPVALAVAAAAGAVSARLGRALFPSLALVAAIAVTTFLAPFSRPLPPGPAAELAGRPVLFPERFQRQSEMFRYLAHGAIVRSYPCNSIECFAPGPIDPDVYVAALARSNRAPPGFTVVTSRPVLRTRHSLAEIQAMVTGDLGPLIEWLLILKPAAASAAR